MPKVAGFVAKARWGHTGSTPPADLAVAPPAADQVLSFQSYRVTDADTGVDITNSEMGGYSGAIASCQNVRITLDFPTFDTTENLFVAPRQMQTNQYGHFILHCNGTADVVNRWDLLYARVASVDMSGRVGVGGGQPVSATLENFGTFKRPGEP